MNNKIALITGGSRGIGYGIAQCLAKEGWNLAINGVRPESAVKDILLDLRTEKNTVIYCQGNVGERRGRKRIVSEVLDHFGYINVLINNAGVAPQERSDLLEMSVESYDKVMDINLKGTFFLSQLAAKAMIDSKVKDPDFEAAIVNISSISSTIASISRGQYCISKAGMSMVTQLFATRLGENDIPVYEVQPGIIDTDMTSAVREKYDRLLANDLAIQKRWGYPEDVGKAVAALVRGDFLYSTGQVFMVDGGLTVRRL